MKTLTYFFRHPHTIYFSIEKLFHAVAEEMGALEKKTLSIKTVALPFVSKLATIGRNLRFVRSAQSDINHVTGDIHYTILGCDRKNINILTIHDCVLLHRYHVTSPRHWLIRLLWYELPSRKADMITVISENTRTDLLKFTSCAESKIRVIPNFVDPKFFPVTKKFDSALPKLLFIGTAPNKNLETTIDALEGMDVELIIVGYLTDTQTSELNNKQIRYRLLNKLTDTEMRTVYGEADMMLFPSTYEGFGLPIIEAQATGRPVLTSRIEPMVSVAGNAACLVDPFDAGSIRDGVKKIIGDATYREILVKSGFLNVKRFALQEVSRQYADLYEEMIHKKAG